MAKALSIIVHCLSFARVILNVLAEFNSLKLSYKLFTNFKTHKYMDSSPLQIRRLTSKIKMMKTQLSSALHLHYLEALLDC